MIRKPFLGLKKPELKYNVEALPFEELPIPQEVTVFLKTNEKFGEKLFKVGDEVKTGQKIEGSTDYVVIPVTGKIAKIFPYSDAFGQTYNGIKIESSGSDDWDGSFTGKSTLDAAIDFLGCAPGKFSFSTFSDATNKIDTIIINGMDVDLNVTVNQRIVKDDSLKLKKSIDVLKKVTGASHFILVVPETLSAEAANSGAAVKTIPAIFPNALPIMIIKKVLDKVVPAGKNPEDIGIAVISAENAVAVGEAFSTGKLPVTKALSVIGKDGAVVNVKARIGTSIGSILDKCNITLGENDRVILGGPMMGIATYSKDLPIEPDTDAITVQSESDSGKISTCQCINCGECVRICPAKIQVNLLGRFAECALYEDAVENDLYSCIECGLCAYVCTARRPLLQYIKMAKHELELIELSEAIDE
jgi:H+/Na+-translocating ferredoxin:NAD+ oxidoreductase subunit C